MTKVMYLLLLLTLCLTSKTNTKQELREIVIQCEGENTRVVNSSINSFIWFQHVDLLALESCPLTSIPGLLATMERKVPNIGSLSIRSSPTIRKTYGQESSTHRSCSSNLRQVNSVKISIVEAENNLSPFLTYLARCSSLTNVEITGGLASIPSFYSPGLVNLKLGQNIIREIQTDSWSGLSNLRTLDLTDNKLVRIPTGSFKVNKKLKIIIMDRNIISFITRQSFQGLQHLEELSLSRNDLSSMWLQTDVFNLLHHLKILNLSDNRLSDIKPELFRSLSKLEVIDLSSNQITEVSSYTFGELDHLIRINLAANRLSVIGRSTFSSRNASSLEELDLSENQIRSVDSYAFQNLSSLSTLSLSKNSLESIPLTVQSLPNLISLNLAENKISELSIESFQSSLKNLNLQGNTLRVIHPSAFRLSSNIERLDLRRNQLRSLDGKILEKSNHLKTLLLDFNELEDINGVMSSLDSLQQLSITNNNLKWFDMAFFPKSLEVINLQKNMIEDIGNYYKMYENFSLHSLDLSYNQITYLEQHIFVDSIQEINLEGNKIAEIGPGTFYGLPNLTKVNLQNNSLRTLPRSSLKIVNFQATFLLSSNPLMCDCSLEWIISSPTAPSGPLVEDLENLKCTPHSVQEPSTSIYLTEVPREKLLCQYTQHCFSLCRCCTFLACDCRMKCPDPCTCFHDQSWNQNSIYCGNKSLTRVPREIPMDSTSIHLDDNHLGDLAPEIFLGRIKVINLYLNHSRVTSLEKGTLAGLNNLESLHLDHNQLQTLGPDIFTEVLQLQRLHLHNNQLNFISNSSFSTLNNLIFISLHNNQLTTIQFEVSSLPSLRRMTLHGNIWGCSCNLAHALERLKKHAVRHLPSIGCRANGHSSDMGQQTLTNLISSCKNMDVLAISSPTYSSPLVVIVISVAVVILLLASVLLLLFLSRQSITAWLYSKSNLHSSEEGGRVSTKGILSESSEKYYSPQTLGRDSDKSTQQLLPSPSPVIKKALPSLSEYAAYIHYCMVDDNYIQQSFAPHLQKVSRQAKLCLHHRDLLTSATVGQAISRAVVQSSCLIILATQEYFQSSIPSYELQMILSEVLLTDGYPVVVVVKNGSVPDIRCKFKEQVGCQSDTWTFLDLNHVLFWDQLSKCMPASNIHSDSSASDHSSNSSQLTVLSSNSSQIGTLIKTKIPNSLGVSGSMTIAYLDNQGRIMNDNSSTLPHKTLVDQIGGRKVFYKSDRSFNTERGRVKGQLRGRVINNPMNSRKVSNMLPKDILVDSAGVYASVVDDVSDQEPFMKKEQNENIYHTITKIGC